MAGIHDTILQRIRREQAQLDLNGRDGVHGIGFANGARADLAQTNASNLALLDQVGQSLDRGFDRSIRIDS